MGLTPTVEPAIEPVTLAELKNYLRVDDGSQNTVLTNLIKAARINVEHEQKRQLITATWEHELDEFPAGDIVIPHPPLISVTSISYEDVAGDTQTWAASNYQVDTAALRGTVSVEPSQSYPTTEADRKNAVTITYKAGYGISTTDVPETTRFAIMMLAAHWHENREPVVIGMTTSEIPMHVKSLINAHGLKFF